MRNDVKFGLTIGGLLVFILIIWVSVVNRGAKQAATGTDVSIIEGGGTGQATTPAPGSVAPATPSAKAPLDSTGVAVTPPAAPPIHTATGDLTTPPASGTVASADSTGGTSSAAHDWLKLLNSGADSTPINTPSANTPNIIPASDTHVDLTSDGLASPAPATRPTGLRTHTIQQGETFSTISAAVYGSSKYYAKLIAANPNVNPNRLKIGEIIEIPDLASNSVTPSAPVAAGPDAAGAATPIDPNRSYRVGSGDTLEKIARKLYGRGSDWQKIYDLNKDLIGPNPGRLTLNMVLRLPEPPTVATAN